MSLDVVSKCLELDIDETQGTRRRPANKDAMTMISTKRQGVWTELRKLQKKQRKEVLEKRKKKKHKSAIELYKEQNEVDNTESNVEALLRITELGKVKQDTARQILYHQPNRLARDVQEPEKEEESSVFTEEDFKNFAKEYRPK